MRKEKIIFFKLRNFNCNFDM